MVTVSQVIALASEPEEDRRIVVDAIAPKESVQKLERARRAKRLIVERQVSGQASRRVRRQTRLSSESGPSSRPMKVLCIEPEAEAELRRTTRPSRTPRRPGPSPR
jgi:hypothetical protein